MNTLIADNMIHDETAIADIASGEPQALDETEEVKWLSLEEAKELKLTPHVIERLELAFKGH